MLSSHVGLLFEVLYLISVAHLSNRIYKMQEKKLKKIFIYENRINFLTTMGTNHGEHRYKERG